MTRDELVTFICTSTGYGEPDDIAACQTFLIARDRMIYDSALWKDALVMVEIAVDPVNNPDHAEGIIFLPEVIARPVAVRTLENAVRVTDLGQYFRIDPDQFARTGQPFEFAIMNPAFYVFRHYASGAYDVNSIGLALPDGAAGIASTARVVWRDQDGNRYTTNCAVGNVLNFPDGSTQLSSGRIEIEAIFCQANTGGIGLFAYDQGHSPPRVFLNVVLDSAATRSPSYQRLRLFGMPTVATTLRVLGKSKYQPLDYATQEPSLRNSENALIALTRGDLLRRGGENGSAMQAFQEGTALLQQLKDLEAVQAASNSRIIPESGYGPDQSFLSEGLTF